MTWAVCPGASIPAPGKAPIHTVTRLELKVTLSCQLRGLPPVLVIDTICGSERPGACVRLKVRLSGETIKIGAPGAGGGCIVSCTDTDWVFWVGDIVRVMEPG